MIIDCEHDWKRWAIREHRFVECSGDTEFELDSCMKCGARKGLIAEDGSSKTGYLPRPSTDTPPGLYNPNLEYVDGYGHHFVTIGGR